MGTSPKQSHTSKLIVHEAQFRMIHLYLNDNPTFKSSASIYDEMQIRTHHKAWNK